MAIRQSPLSGSVPESLTVSQSLSVSRYLSLLGLERKQSGLCGFALMAALVLSGEANAHTASPFVLPDAFDTKAESISVQSGITVEKFYVPSRNFKTAYTLTTPEGQSQTVAAAATLKRFSVADLPLNEEGTYRIRTTDAEDTISKYALVNNRWLRIRAPRPALPAGATAKPGSVKPQEGQPMEGKPAENAMGGSAAPVAPQPPRFIAEDQIPLGAKVIEVRTTPIAESYVSKGRPTAVPATMGKGFELKLLSHPSLVFAGDTLKAQVLLDGKPLPGLDVEVFKGAGNFEPNAKREQPAQKTNTLGEVSIPFSMSGIYLITIAYPAPDEDANSPPTPQAYSYGLTLEVGE